MLNNLTNFFNLIVGRRIKTQLESDDLIAIGTKQSPALGDYKPTAIKFSDLQAQVGGLQSVAVDGVTITGDGTPGNPLVAVAPTPAYKVYSALLTQTGTSNPVEIVLENTLGNIVWTRSGAGDYVGTLVGAFTLNKTAIILGKNFTLSTVNIDPYDITVDTYGSTDTVVLNTMVNGTGLSDGKLNKTFIEIRVYN